MSTSQQPSPTTGPARHGDPPRIVVGYDGSPIAQAALSYAANRAGSDGKVFIAHAFTPPPEWRGTSYYEASRQYHEQAGRELVGSIPQDLLAGVAYEQELVEGAPAEALTRLAEAQEADEIVVGSRGFGPFRATLGSTSHALLHHANRPVVIIPARTLGAVREGGAARRVVVGYDGSATAKDALAHAAYRAGDDGELVAVHAYRTPFEYAGTPFEGAALADFQRNAREKLDEIGPEMTGNVSVEPVVVEGPIADALVGVAQTRNADEIVVGSRGLGRLAAAIGSVSHAVLHEADRPVVVVPHTPTPEEIEYAERVQLAKSFRRRPRM